MLCFCKLDDSPPLRLWRACRLRIRMPYPAVQIPSHKHLNLHNFHWLWNPDILQL